LVWYKWKTTAPLALHKREKWGQVEVGELKNKKIKAPRKYIIKKIII
jgi:hypothetical protein